MENVESLSFSRIGVLGAGTWGITLAGLLLDKGFPVAVWDIDRELLEYIHTIQSHPRLKMLNLQGLQVSYLPHEMIGNSDLVVIAVPSKAMRQSAEVIKKSEYTGKTFLICTKGIEHSSLKFMSQVVEEALDTGKYSLAVLSGPSHAEEVAEKKPASVTIACQDISVAQKLQKVFYTPYFRTYTNTDIIGVQIGGSIKNIIAIAAGISDGLELGDNAKAALITRGLAEINRFGKKLGCNPLTLMGLSGVGDLIVTAMSSHSRNWTFGLYLGQGYSVVESLKKVEMTVEGYYTVQAMIEFCRKLKIEMPISQAVYRIVYENAEPKKEVSNLMEREIKKENSD